MTPMLWSFTCQAPDKGDPCLGGGEEVRSLLGEQKATPCFHSSKCGGVDSELPAPTMTQWASAGHCPAWSAHHQNQMFMNHR